MTTERQGRGVSKAKKAPKSNSATTGYEAELWQMADTLRGSMDAAEYKHVVLGLIFLKYVSDAFEEAYAKLETERHEGADPEDPDEYRAQSIFWVPVRGALAETASAGAPAHRRTGRGQGYDCHRAGQPRARWTCCPRTTPGPRWTRPAWDGSLTW